jgi:hypothetical protein
LADRVRNKSGRETWHRLLIAATIERRPDYCGHPQLYQTWVQYIHVIARPSTLPAARSSVSSGTSILKIISSLSTQSATSVFMEPFPPQAFDATRNNTAK